MEEVNKLSDAVNEATTAYLEATKTNEENMAVLAIWNAIDADGDRVLKASIAGNGKRITEMLSTALKANPQLAVLFKKALQTAAIDKLAELLDDATSGLADFPKGGDIAPHNCDCPACTARRERAKSNPNIN